MSVLSGSVETVAPMTIANHGPVHEIRKLLETREVGIFFSRLKPKAELPLEVHPFVEVIYRLKGRTRMRIGDGDYIIDPGSYAIIPVGVWHQTTSLEDDENVEQLVLCAYSQNPGNLLEFLREQTADAFAVSAGKS